jgi:hypothetical protein
MSEAGTGAADASPAAASSACDYMNGSDIARSNSLL